MLNSIARVKQFIAENWEKTIRFPNQQSETEVHLPYPFIVPTAGPFFHIFFYWDTYFASEGLIRSGLLENARYNAENMLHLIDTLGYVPNFTLKDQLNRSQPPVASALVRAIYKHTHDKTWLSHASSILAKEHAFWMSMRRGPHGLNHYAHHGNPKDVEYFYEVIHERLGNIPEDKTERMIFLTHSMAEAESGWDFTPRFNYQCANFYPVDLNSLLYMHESNAAWFCEELGNGKASLWRERATYRRELMDRYCWNDQNGFYYDYNFSNNQPSPVASAAAFFALWSGLPSVAQAEKMVHNLPLLEYNFGMVACQPGPRPPGQHFQWDYPNAWAPSQYAAIAGLLRYGYIQEARRLAEKYVACVANSFDKTGNLWEKYNGVNGSVDVIDEYKMPAMLGWTAGTFLYACEVLES